LPKASLSKIIEVRAETILSRIMHSDQPSNCVDGEFYLCHTDAHFLSLPHIGRKPLSAMQKRMTMVANWGAQLCLT
jgi:hypothetical protein